MIAYNYRQHPGFANLIDDLCEPGAACVRVVDAPHLLAGINHDSVRDAHSDLIHRPGSESCDLDIPPRAQEPSLIA